jgi:hypothetical protein
MRYGDCPTVEVTKLVPCDPETAWRLVTDIRLPLRCSSELQDVEWLDGATGVAVGARFRGHNSHVAMGDWATQCEIVEVDDGRRWVWNVQGPDGVAATWGFEVEPSSRGALVRQWARMGPGPSGLTYAITANPDKEGRIVARRLEEWQAGMAANLDCLAGLIDTP